MTRELKEVARELGLGLLATTLAFIARKADQLAKELQQ